MYLLTDMSPPPVETPLSTWLSPSIDELPSVEEPLSVDIVPSPSPPVAVAALPHPATSKVKRQAASIFDGCNFIFLW